MYAEILETESTPAPAAPQGPIRRPGRALPFDSGGLAKARVQTAGQARALVEELASGLRWSGRVIDRLSRTRKRTIGAIVEAVIGLLDAHGRCYASAATIASYAGCDRSTFFRLWPEIEFAGLLVAERRQSGPNFYYLGAALIDRMLERLETPGWSKNPDSIFWQQYRRWLGRSTSYQHSHKVRDISAKSRLNFTPDCLDSSDQHIQRCGADRLAKPETFPPQTADDTTATPPGKGALRPALRSGPCPPSLGRETEKLPGGECLF
ncbi:MAG: hypothetical protein KME03_11370 [Aphanocapsa lilacina HA4352-LM1]|nr:hypothetical protein [Aphanocapsa lilacina HA4352-LM1]